MTYWQYALVALIHAILFCAGTVGMAVLNGNTDGLLNFTFVTWDAVHFKHIVQLGYNELTVAFFPFFPLVWKYSGMGAIGISCFNALLFLASAAGLGRLLQVPVLWYLILLTSPALIFMGLPYPEALLFAFFVLVMAGWKKNKMVWVALGLFFASFCKPNASVLLPAFIGWFIWWTPRDQKSIKLFVTCVTAILGGTFLALGVQYIDTGELFGFFRSQKEWGNALRWPNWPLSSWGHISAKLMDAVSLWISMLAGLYLVFSLLQPRDWRQKRQLGALAASFLAFTGLYVLLFRGGELFSLNRFVMASPFFWLFISGLERELPRRSLWVFIGAWLLIALSFGAYVHIRFALTLTALGLLLWIIHFSMSHYKSHNILGYIVYAVLLAIQVFFGFRTTLGEWLG